MSYSINFSAPETVEQLAAYVGLDALKFKMAIDPALKTGLYLCHRIPKRNAKRSGQERIVWQAFPPWLEAHKAVARRFDLFARAIDPRFPHSSACGFVRHRSTLENAKPHCGAPRLMRADIRDFFSSISVGRLAQRFRELQVNDEPAEALAEFVTIDGALALGLNSSPMLANLISVNLDIKLSELASRYDCVYTRYADDISISGKGDLPSRSELEGVLEEEQFSLAIEKFRITKIGQAHYVTGLSVSDPVKPHAPRHMKRRLRQELYYAEKFSIKNHLKRLDSEKIQRGINRLDGTVRYVSHIEKQLFSALRERWARLLQRDGCYPSYQSFSIKTGQPATICYIDETEISFGIKKYLALGLVFTQSPELIDETTQAIHQQFEKGDPFYAGDKAALSEKGVHFVDAHPDLRTTYINALESLPFRAFIVFGELMKESDYQDLYISLLKLVLPPRLIKYDGLTLDFVVEQNQKIKESALKSAIAEVYQSLASYNSRRPVLEPSVTVGSKKNTPAFSAPDFVLAIFSRYAQSNCYEKEQARIHQFERLRDKIRLIIDANSGERYSRRMPFVPWPKPN